DRARAEEAAKDRAGKPSEERLRQLEKKLEEIRRQLEGLRKDLRPGKKSGRSAGSATGRVYINKRNFQIPVQVGPRVGQHVRELLLYLSEDEGRTYRVAARAAPTSRSLPFTAPRDGVFSFQVATVDDQGQQEPADVSKAPPGLVVVVDTVAPSVKLVGDTPPGDRGRFQWHVHDDNLEIQTLRIHVRGLRENTETGWTEL